MPRVISRSIAVSLIGFALLVMVFGGCATSKGATAGEKRQYSLEMRDETLQKFYVEDASLRSKTEDSAGYAVFSNIGTKIIFVSTGGGFGAAHDNSTGEDTFMKMAALGVGVGLGVKDFRALFLFRTGKALGKFIDDGWEWGAEADAAAKTGDQGEEASGAGDISSDMEVYQLTENGLVLSATISGTKYWKDEALN